MLYFLLIVIAVGVLLISKPGRFILLLVASLAIIFAILAALFFVAVLLYHTNPEVITLIAFIGGIGIIGLFFRIVIQPVLMKFLVYTEFCKMVSLFVNKNKSQYGVRVFLVALSIAFVALAPVWIIVFIFELMR